MASCFQAILLVISTGAAYSVDFHAGRPNQALQCPAGLPVQSQKYYSSLSGRAGVTTLLPYADSLSTDSVTLHLATLATHPGLEYDLFDLPVPVPLPRALPSPTPAKCCNPPACSSA